MGCGIPVPTQQREEMKSWDKKFAVASAFMGAYGIYAGTLWLTGSETAAATITALLAGIPIVTWLNGRHYEHGDIQKRLEELHEEDSKEGE